MIFHEIDRRINDLYEKGEKKMNEPEEKCTNFSNFRRRNRFDKSGHEL